MAFSATILVFCIRQLSYYNQIININGTGILAIILDIIKVFVY